MTTRIKLRRDTAANWTANNPILAAGEPGLETDTRKMKYGDGTTAWADLSYSSGFVARPLIGQFTLYGPVPNDANNDWWFDTVVADPDGNAYYLGGNNHSGGGYDGKMNVVKVDVNGNVAWQKEISWPDGYEGAATSAVYNTATDRLVVLGHTWQSIPGQNYDDGASVFSMNPTTGAIVGDVTIIRDDYIVDDSGYGAVQEYDIALTDSGDPIVVGETWDGQRQVYALTTQTGSAPGIIFADATVFPAGAYPIGYNNWYVTGTNIANQVYVTSVNYYDNQLATNLASSGTNAAFNIEWRLKGSEVYFPNSSSKFGIALNQNGSGYVVNDTLFLNPNQYGGLTSATITVTAVGGSGEITDFTTTATFNTSTVKIIVNSAEDFGATGSWQAVHQDGQAFVWTPSWARAFGDTSWDVAAAVDVDSAGNIYVAGRTYDYSRNNGETRGILTKISSSGNLIWSKNFDPENFDDFNDGYTGVAVDSNDDIIIVHDEVITKVNGNGVVLWQKWIEPGNPLYTWNMCVDVDSDDNIYVAGEIDYAGNGNNDNFQIVKFDTDGNVLWQRETGTSQDEDTQWNNGYQILTVQGDKFYLAGSTYQGGDDVGFGIIMPTDGSGASDDFQGKFFYSTTTWTIATSTATVDTMEIFFTATNLSVTTTSTFVGEDAGVDVTTRGLRTGSDGRIEDVYSISFEDGSVQTTAFIGGLSPSGDSPFIYDTNDLTLRLDHAGKMIRWYAQGWGNTVSIYIPNNDDVPFPIGTQIRFMKDQGIRAFMFWNGVNGNDGDITILPSSPDSGMQGYMYNSGEGWSVRHPDWTEIPALVTLTKVNTNRWLLSCDSPTHIMDWSW